MKNSLKIIVIAVMAVVLAATAYFIWSNYFGTALNNRVNTGKAAAKSARTAAGKIDAISKRAKALPASWSGLKIDEAAEANKIMEDSGSNRGYKVDVLRDDSAAKIQKDIISAESDISYAIGDAQAAIKTIERVSWYLPASNRTDFNAAKDEANRAIKTGETLAKNLKELKNDVDIWGFLSVSLKINNALMTRFGQVSENLKSGDYVAASAGAQEILAGVNESVTWLAHGKQELTNVSSFSKDSNGILAFISKEKTAGETFNNAAAAGARGDAEQFTVTQQLADTQLAELRKTASEKSVASDFVAWFITNAERRLKSPKS